MSAAGAEPEPSPAARSYDPSSRPEEDQLLQPSEDPSSSDATQTSDSSRIPATYPDADLEARYAGWPLCQLEERAAALDKASREQAATILNDRRRRGLYEEIVVERGKPAPTQPGAVTELVEIAGPGLVRYTMSTIPEAEYPDWKLQHDELTWLYGRIGQLKVTAKKNGG
jgi:hypothetical protein